MNDCLRKAMDLLARQAHFRRQLEHKLIRRGFSEADVGEACDRLEERGYLDDLESARGLARGRMRRKGYGPRRLRAELRKRGASEGIAEVVVDEAFAGGEMALLKESALGWLRVHEWDRERLARHLERKGFSASVILELLRELARDRAEPEQRESP